MASLLAFPFLTIITSLILLLVTVLRIIIHFVHSFEPDKCKLVLRYSDSHSEALCKIRNKWKSRTKFFSCCKAVFLERNKITFHEVEGRLYSEGEGCIEKLKVRFFHENIKLEFLENWEDKRTFEVVKIKRELILILTIEIFDVNTL